jgi:hypothetical protein
VARATSESPAYAAEVRAALRRVTTSLAFGKSTQLAQFLGYVVEETLAGRAGRLKAYTIATEALGRGAKFDAQTDPIVRVGASRLRRALDSYYAAEGCDDPIVIALPRGSYVPVFRRNSVRVRAYASVQALRQRIAGTARANYRLLLLIVAVAIGVSLALDAIEMMVAKTVWPALQQAWHAVAPDTTGGARP